MSPFRVVSPFRPIMSKTNGFPGRPQSCCPNVLGPRGLNRKPLNAVETSNNGTTVDDKSPA